MTNELNGNSTTPVLRHDCPSPDFCNCRECIIDELTDMIMNGMLND